MTGTQQTLTATFINAQNAPVTNQVLAFSVTGANTASGVVTPPTSRATQPSPTRGPAAALTARKGRLHRSFLARLGYCFFTWFDRRRCHCRPRLQPEHSSPKAANRRSFVAKPGDTPAFRQTFPNIDFNPLAGSVAGNTSGVDPTTRPFTDVVTNSDNLFKPTIPAKATELRPELATSRASTRCSSPSSSWPSQVT